MTMMRDGMLAIWVSLLVLVAVRPAAGVEREHRELGEGVIVRALEYLRGVQGEDGSWSPEPGPGVTALVLAGFVSTPGVDREDEAVRRGLEYILSHQREDGGFYDSLLANYNTSIVLMALGRLGGGDARLEGAVAKAQGFLRALQWADDKVDSKGERITSDHPWFGGAGYGKHGRPDLSNTAMMIAGLHDSGLHCEDPAYQRAMKFITMLQGTEANTALGDQIVADGGFIYATSTDKEHIGTPQSFAGTVVDSTGRSRLRTYGSMTYAGFMSYLYAQMDREDRRVVEAYGWIERNYTLAENPGMGMAGYYYYLHLLARALYAWGEPTIRTADGVEHDWREELIERLAGLQQADGSFANEQDRWMEADTNLVTAYAVLALHYALE